MTDAYQFGYPLKCERCAGSLKSSVELRVAPYFKPGVAPRVILIGQDPTIYRKPERVKEVLMLNMPGSQLSRWLKEMFGEENFSNTILYATNLVKCSFFNPPSAEAEGGLRFLTPFFNNCREYLENELLTFKPDCVLTLGEPAHKLFVTILDNQKSIPDSMKSAFCGEFYKASLKQFEFDYSPCLHIKTFRVAEVYGNSVQKFKKGFSTYFTKNH